MLCKRPRIFFASGDAPLMAMLSGAKKESSGRTRMGTASRVSPSSLGEASDIGASSRRDHCPELVCAGFRRARAKPGRPLRFVAELVTPGPEAARAVMQAVLLREADRAVDLVSDCSADARRLAATDFCRRNQRR